MFAARPPASVVQIMILLVVSIRQKNPRCVDRASSTTRLYVTHMSRRTDLMINMTTGDHYIPGDAPLGRDGAGTYAVRFRGHWVQPMGCPLLDLLSGSRQTPYIHGKEVARFDLAALFAFQRPVTENFNGNVAEVFHSSAVHDSN